MNLHTISRLSAIFAGLIFIAAGTGKVPGQAEFSDVLLKSLWTPAAAHFVGYVLPWLETGLGILLLAGLFSRIAAAICLPLIAGFLANNSWALIQGVEKFPECASCFGVWEEFLGSFSPPQALAIDIVLLGLILCVILFSRGGFFTLPSWLTFKKGEGLKPARPSRWYLGLLMIMLCPVLYVGCALSNSTPVINRLEVERAVVAPSTSLKMTCLASDPDGDPLSYGWSASGGYFFGKGPDVTWVAPQTLGVYTITVTVLEDSGGEVTKQVNIQVRDNRRPVIENLTARPRIVRAANTSVIECAASDPDGDKLTYIWEATGGNITGSGATASWTAPNRYGSYVIQVIVRDDLGAGTSQRLEVIVTCCG